RGELPRGNWNPSFATRGWSVALRKHFAKRRKPGASVLGNSRKIGQDFPSRNRRRNRSRFARNASREQRDAGRANRRISEKESRPSHSIADEPNRFLSTFR